MRTWATVAALLLAAPLLPITAEAASYTTTAFNFYWSPSSRTINVGDSITYTNGGGSHNFQHVSGPTNIGSCSLPCTKTYTVAGTYNFRCGVHPSTMQGSVTVVSTPPPSVSISSPTAGSSVSGTISVSGTASHTSQSISKVEVRVDNGAYALATITSGAGTKSVSWTYNLNTAAHADGSHAVKARATTSGGVTGESSVTVTFVNGPTTVIDAPSAGATLSGLVSVTGTATSPSAGITAMDVRLDSGGWVPATITSGAGTTSVSWSATIDSTASVDGAHTISARGWAGSAVGLATSVGVTFANAPTPVFTAPTAGEDVQGVYLVTGSATSPSSPIASVQVALDSGAFAPATITSGAGTTSVTWEYSLDTMPLTLGAHTLTARATASTGQASTASVAFDVANPPTTDLTVTSVGGTTGTFSSSITVNFANGGNTATGSFFYKLEYLYKGTWRTIGQPSMTSIPAFGSASHTVTWPSGLFLYGRFEIRATADSTGVVAELDETNNEKTGTAAFVTSFVPGVDARSP